MNLNEIRARASAASPGSWQRHGADVRIEGLTEPLFRGRDDSAVVREQADRDAEFVAHARADVLALLDLLDLIELPDRSADVARPAGAEGPVAGTSPAPNPSAAPDPRVAGADSFF